MSDEDRTRAEQIGCAAAREVTRFWLNEVAKIEEAVDKPGARWDLLKQAMSIIARGPERG